MTTANELTSEYVYTQILAVPKNLVGTFEEDMTVYVSNALNDPEKNLGGVMFYKAVTLKGKEENHMVIQFQVNFHLFAISFWNDTVQNKLKTTYLAQFLSKYDNMSLYSEHVYEMKNKEKRRPVYYGNGDQPDGGQPIPGKNCCEKFLNYWLIVPRVQWDFFALMYQMYTFDITHQGFIPKFVHFFTIPTNVMLSVCFLAQWSFFGLSAGHGAFHLNASLMLLIILVTLYTVMSLIWKSWPWGIATDVVLFVCWMTGNLWYNYYKTPGNPWYNPTTIATNPILWSYIISFIQASSHMIVPQLPPYITGVNHWEALHMFFCVKAKNQTSRCRQIFFITAALLAFPILSVAVAWFSWPHLIGTEIIYIMAGIGYKPKFFEKYLRVVEKAELTGNPGLDVYPTNPDELMNDSPAMIERLKEEGLVSQNPTTAEVIKEITSCRLAQKYFNHGIKKNSEDDLRPVIVIQNGMHLTKRNAV